MTSSLQSEDPFNTVKSEVEKSLGYLDELSASLQQQHRQNGLATDPTKFKQTMDELKSNLKTIEWDVQDLEETIRIAQANPQRFRIDSAELLRRRQFVDKVLNRISIIQKDSTLLGEASNQKVALSQPVSTSSSSSTNKNNKSQQPISNNTNNYQNSNQNNIHDEFIRSEASQQQALLKRQDEQFDSVHGTVINLKNIAITMGNELDDQAVLLENLDTKVDNSSGKLKAALNRIQNILKSDGGDTRTTIIIIVLAVIVFILLMSLIF